MTDPTVPNTMMLKSDQSVPRFFVAIVIVVSIFILWFSAGDHSLYPPDEGRYGSVSLHMAQGGSWLVPVFEGHVHLTKPPLIYWLQAVSIRVLGRNELAVRLPGLVASSILILLLFRFTRKIVGVRTALLAIGGLAVTPMFVFVSRLAIIDPLLNLCWFAVLIYGYQFAQDKEHPTKYALLAWLALSLGLFTKGPVALMPVGVLMIWIIISRNHLFMRNWKLWLGIPHAFIPLIIWALLVMKIHPDAWQVWKHELFDRAAGTGAHNEPIWYYIPILFAGFLPLSALMPIPFWNLNVRYVWSKLRGGSLESFLLLAVFIPFIIFSLISGKLITYLMPIGQPLAILVALYLNDALQRIEHPERVAGRWFKRRPISIGMVAVGSTALAIITVSAAYQLHSDYLWMTIPFILAAVLAFLVRILWNYIPERRGAAIMLLWIGAMGLWFCVEESEDIILAQAGARQFFRRIENIKPKPAEITTFGFNDPTLSFYLNADVHEFTSYDDLLHAFDDLDDQGFILIAGADRWDKLLKRNSEIAARFTMLATALASRNRTVYILKSR